MSTERLGDGFRLGLTHRREFTGNVDNRTVVHADLHVSGTDRFDRSRVPGVRQHLCDTFHGRRPLAAGRGQPLPGPVARELLKPRCTLSLCDKPERLVGQLVMCWTQRRSADIGEAVDVAGATSPRGRSWPKGCTFAGYDQAVGQQPLQSAADPRWGNPEPPCQFTGRRRAILGEGSS